MKKKAPTQGPAIRDRVRELRRVKAGTLVPHPSNWRIHGPDQTRMLKGVLDDLGFAGAIITRELPDGRLQVLDGHLRQHELDPTMEVPCIVTDLNDEEAAKFL